MDDAVSVFKEDLAPVPSSKAMLSGVGASASASPGHSVSAVPGWPSQQLEFHDDTPGAVVYSVLVTGPNQNGDTPTLCVPTPGRVTQKANWWWSGRTNVDTFYSANCTGAHATAHLWFDINPTTQWRCLSDLAPYPDWSCNGAATLKAAALRSNGTSGYAVDEFGNLTAFGGAPKINSGLIWTSDVVRGLALVNDSSGYILDDWGALHPFGGAPDPGNQSGHVWPGLDVARGVAVNRFGGGYVLDDWGGLHAFGGAPASNSTFSRPGQDIARSVALDPNGTPGVVLDSSGGIWPFAPPGRPSQQLVFFDDTPGAVVYSILVTGPNQDGNIASTCVRTPGHTTEKAGWWWSGHTTVATFITPDCTIPPSPKPPHPTGPLWFDPDHATQLRCLSDVAPYPDWSCTQPYPADYYVFDLSGGYSFVNAGVSVEISYSGHVFVTAHVGASYGNGGGYSVGYGVVGTPGTASKDAINHFLVGNTYTLSAFAQVPGLGTDGTVGVGSHDPTLDIAGFRRRRPRIRASRVHQTTDARG